ncbi:MAG: hypothetical protein P9L97_08640 [Candidatus Tenebribacter davisii]|nr:hypothetical protein [Candidatus Tenebribacter davisii]
MIKKKNKAPLIIIGVGGASSSGKTTLFNSISNYLTQENSVHFDLDGYHFHSRKKRKELNEFPEDLKANDFNKIINDIMSLKSGKTIDMPFYNHIKGNFSSQISLSPKPIIFVEGLHAIMINDISQQKITDLSIFLYPDDNLRKSWKVKRDVNERGYFYSQAIEQIANRKNLVSENIYSQIKIADILVHIHRRKNNFLDHRVLLSHTFYDKYPNENPIRKLLLNYFNMKEIIFKDKQYIEIHLKNNSEMIDSLKEKISYLGLLTSIPMPTSHSKNHYSFTEIVDILIVLMMIILIGENYG